MSRPIVTTSLDKLKVIRSEEQFEYLGEEYQRLNATYDLFQRYRISFGMFMAKPWYYRIFVELLEDATSVKPQLSMQLLLDRQRRIALKADQALLREETKPRLHGGEIFQPLYHHRHRRGGQLHFTRKLRP